MRIQESLRNDPYVLLLNIEEVLGMKCDVTWVCKDYTLVGTDGKILPGATVPDLMIAVTGDLAIGLPEEYYANKVRFPLDTEWQFYVPVEIKTNADASMTYGHASHQLRKFAKNIALGRDPAINPYDMAFGVIVNGTSEHPAITRVGLCYFPLNAFNSQQH
ncbi:MAG: hypothetical protein HY365_03335 [Candidatus Aenigmarchaeota archaeon]|nr:hypothetical protein [Candidatus Aenigmarchaeota archaeon]